MVIWKLFSVQSVKSSSRTALKVLRKFSTATDGILRSGAPDLDLPEISIPELLRPRFAKFEKYVATECVITGRKYTFGDILRKSENLGKCLRKKLKLNEGDVVAVLLPNVPEYPLINLGVLGAGMILTTLNPIYTPEEISRQLNDSSAKVIITLVEFWNVALSATRLLNKQLPIIAIKTEVATIATEFGFSPALSQYTAYHNPFDEPGLKVQIERDINIDIFNHLVLGKQTNLFIDFDSTSTKVCLQPGQALPDGAIDFREFTDTKVDFPVGNRKPSDTATLPYSSGTTGLPKGVELSHRNLLANIMQNISPETDIFHEPSDNHQDVTPAVLPMFHIYGYTITSMVALCRGSKVVTLPKFTPDSFVSLLRDHRPHILLVVPPMVLFMSSQPTVKSEYFQALRTVVCGAAPLGAPDEQRFMEKTGKNIQFIQGYGMTETSPTISLTPTNMPSVKIVSGSVGTPVAGTLVKVVAADDPNSAPLGPNTPGELLVKGPQVMKGYFNKPEETENAFVDGWLRTGDMVYYNEDNLLFVTDRLKELIKVKGFQVPPAELEEIIRTYPNVTDAAVIGVPHPIHGECPRAYVVTKTTINPDELDAFVAGKVAPYKRLTGGIEVVQSIPKNASGKIMRRNLKALYEKEHGTS